MTPTEALENARRAMQDAQPFCLAAGMDSLDAGIAEIDAALAAPPPQSPPADLSALEHDLIVECERAMKQRDEYLRTGISTAAPGQSHDTIFGFILRKHLGAVQSPPAALTAEQERAVEAIEQLSQWARAYPLKNFPEPDMVRAHELLQAGGMSIDSISASNMRYVITQVIEIVDAALTRHTGDAE